MDEFSIIRQFFDRPIRSDAVTLGIGDDGAIITTNCGQQQVHVIDTLVEGTHFLATMAARDIAYRAVAVNVSDIAAMGAVPQTMTLALTLADADEAWLEDFASGLFDCADEFGVVLIGGDTTRGACTTVTIAMTGGVENGGALLRSGAKVGDGIYVSGTLGDAAGALQLLQDNKNDEDLLQRFLRPTARIRLGQALVGVASAAIDVSDGLLGDLGKLLTASGCGGRLDIENLPLSDALQRCFSRDEQHRLALCGGDDYELCFTASSSAMTSLTDSRCIPAITRIGTVMDGSGVQCRLHGDIVDCADTGYRHFS